MSAPSKPEQAVSGRGVWVRVLAATLALAAGVTALVIAIELLRSVLA
jgi:hypothetical protein